MKIDRIRGLAGSPFVLGLVVLYSAVRLPLVLSSLPGWYRSGVQQIAMSVAVSTLKHGIPPELVIRQSFSGANIHGMLGAPVLFLVPDLRFVRFVMFLAGLVTLVMFANLLRWTDVSDRVTFATVTLLVITPHFVVYTGFATSVAVTLCFGVASVYGYRQYLSEGGFGWALVSGAGAGLATMNHFWGGIVTVTIFAFDAVVIGVLLWTSEDRKALSTAESRLPLWVVHVLALVPAGLLYFYYQTALTGQAKQIFDHYGGYAVWDASHVLLTPEFYVLMGYWTLQYLPVLVVAVPLAAVAIGRRLDSTPYSWVIREYGDAIGPAPLVFWAIWLASGLAVVLVLPRGAMIHDYYLWWALLPSIGVIGWWANERELLTGPSWLGRASRGDARTLLVLGLFITSVTLTGYHVARAPLDSSDIPGNEAEPVKSMGVHSRMLAAELEPCIREDDSVLLYGETVVRTAAIRVGLVEMSHAIYLRREPITTEHLAGRNLVVSTHNISARLGDDWRHVQTVEAAGYTSRIYRKTSHSHH